MPTAPYDFLETVANMSRVRLNDAIVSIGGEIMTDTAAFSLTAVINAWRRLQEFLADKGVAALDRETVLPSVPACTAADQGTRVWFNWVNYFDGSNLQAAPVLPQDMISPLELFERIHGSTANYTPMDREYNTLPTAPRQATNRLWQWRQETVYMPGANGLTDILMRYAGFLADFLPNGTGPGQQLWSTQPVPLMRSANAFAWYLCAEASRPRGDLDAGQFEQLGQGAAEAIWNREYRQDRALYKGSELGKSPDENSATLGPTGPRGPQRGGGEK